MDKGNDTDSYIPIESYVSMRHKVEMMLYTVLAFSMKKVKFLSQVFQEGNKSCCRK